MTYWASTKFRDFENGVILAFVMTAVAFLMLGGVLFLYEGLGLNFEILDYPSLKAYAIPLGLFLLLLGVLVARFWIVGLERREAGRQPTSPSDSSPGASRASPSTQPQAAPANGKRAA